MEPLEVTQGPSSATLNVVVASFVPALVQRDSDRSDCFSFIQAPPPPNLAVANEALKLHVLRLFVIIATWF